MLKTIRRYTMPTAITVGVFALAATAFAVAGEVNDKAKDKAKEVVAAQTAEESEVEAAEEEAEAESEGGSDGINHGHCVSYWSHASKDAGLEGRNRGKFVSSIAQNKEAVSTKVEEGGSPDATCDFQNELDAALAAQAADEESEVEGADNNRSESKGNGRGKSDDEHGKDVEGS